MRLLAAVLFTSMAAAELGIGMDPNIGGSVDEQSVGLGGVGGLEPEGIVGGDDHAASPGGRDGKGSLGILTNHGTMEMQTALEKKRGAG